MTTQEICASAKNAAIEFATIATHKKNGILKRLRTLILDGATAILKANQIDVDFALKNGRHEAFIDRLKLDLTRISQMADGIMKIISLPDPVGQITCEYELSNGLLLRKVRSALGVVGIIFEARPNVSIDCAALCIKSGNGIVLRGSRESRSSVRLLTNFIKQALEENFVSPNLCGNIDSDDRADAITMLKQNDYIDVIIPRGGDKLKKLTFEEATMPVLAAAGGNCHMYIADSADENMAVNLVLDAKLDRPATCNALETLLIDRKKSVEFIVRLLNALKNNDVEIRGTSELNEIFPVVTIDSTEFYVEYECKKIKVALVNNVKEAVDHIAQYGNGHSEAIVTSDEDEANFFIRHTDSAAVYVNASTRFTDGFEFELGAEIGISTQKFHARGPIGLNELTIEKYVLNGSGQTRGKKFFE
ncbi:MAG: glutamate-5-semialdehyde dehydrogenase [Christensenellaceae bacterium]|jgi:glutamate-5-semialdehyde dehydrogenase|nr:glutamate-5-semialdehyde dehydrogenase [Christensenellaceae bacterium]